MQNPEPLFYFSLPRLIWKWRGQNAARTERNWWETNFVGTLVHLVAYIFSFELLLVRLPVWAQLLLLVPLAFLVWIFWLILFYVSSLVIRLLSAAGIMRHLPRARAQSIMIGTITTFFALELVFTESWTKLIGLVWLGAVVLNLTAAALLALTRANGAAAE